jgi:hypothetical protein
MPAARIAAAVLLILLCLHADSQADTIVLKSGEKVEGKILNETDADVTISVMVTPTIKDERVVKRDEIATIEKVQPDEQAWATIKNFEPGNESLERNEYDRVKAALSYFTSTFPKSPHAPLAQSRLDQFTSEQVRVGLGEVKLNGEWLGKERAMEERIQIGGQTLLNRMKRAAAAGQLPEAMANFDLIEKSFAGAASYPEAVELGRRVLDALSTAVGQRQAALKRRMDDEKQRLTTSKGDEHAQLEALIKKELAATEANIAALERSGVKWLPLQPANTRSLAALATRATTETKRLEGLAIEAMRGSVKAAQDAEKALSAGDLERAEQVLKDAISGWPANELAKRLQTKLVEAKKAAAPAKTSAPPPPKPPASKPKTSSASTDTEPVASLDPAHDGEAPIYKRPFFYIALTVVVAFGAIAGKMIAKSRATSDNLIDK